MKKYLKFLLHFFSIGILALGAVACSDDDEPQATAEEKGTVLSVTPVELVFGKQDTRAQTVEVTTDATVWTAVPDAGWITVTENTGGEFSVTVSENTTGTDRESVIVVATGASYLQAPVKVYQAAKDPTRLEIEPVELTFAFDDAEPQRVNVDTDATIWTVDKGAEWITVTVLENGFDVTVSENPGAEARTATVTVSAGLLSAELTVKQNPDVSRLSWYREFVPENNAPFAAVSDNGVWACGSSAGSGILYNIETGEAQYYSAGEEGGATLLSLFDVSDNGAAVGAYYNYPSVLENGNWTDAGNPDNLEGSVYAVSPDGTLMSGYLSVGGAPVPVMWRGNTLTELEMPATDILGDEPYAGFMVQSMSADGLCVGKDNGLQTGCMWDRNGKFSYYAPDRFILDDSGWNILSYYGDFNAISPDGRYIATTYWDTSEPVYEPPFAKGFPMVYDLQTGTSTVIDHENGRGNVTTVDGVTFFDTVGIGVSEDAMVYENGTITPMPQWLKDNYGIEMPHGGGEPISASADGKTIVGYYHMGNGVFANYIVHLGERIK